MKKARVLTAIGALESQGGITEIQISADRRKVWINVDGICRFRACDTELHVNDASQELIELLHGEESHG